LPSSPELFRERPRDDPAWLPRPCPDRELRLRLEPRRDELRELLPLDRPDELP
jgi:hypothetical protein